MPTQAEIAEHLDMSQQNASQMLNQLNINWAECTLDEVRLAYIRDLRDKAAGRGGTDEAELRKARTREALGKAQLSELNYWREVRELVPVSEIEPLMESWAVYARNEVEQSIQRLALAVESQHRIEINQDVVHNAIEATCRAISGYARHLGGDDAASVEEVVAPEEGADTGVAAH